MAFEESTEAAVETLVVSKLSDLTGVNALAAGQMIEFNSGLTVLFGENAAGARPARVSSL